MTSSMDFGPEQVVVGVRAIADTLDLGNDTGRWPRSVHFLRQACDMIEQQSARITALEAERDRLAADHGDSVQYATAPSSTVSGKGPIPPTENSPHLTVRRFACFTAEDGVYEHAQGEHVTYVDYARLSDQLSQSQAERDHIEQQHIHSDVGILAKRLSQSQARVAELEGANERLKLDALRWLHMRWRYIARGDRLDFMPFIGTFYSLTQADAADRACDASMAELRARDPDTYWRGANARLSPPSGLQGGGDGLR
jgi:hypothetical protein